MGSVCSMGSIGSIANYRLKKGKNSIFDLKTSPVKDHARFLRPWLALGLVPMLCSGCLLVPHPKGHTERHRAFIDYWPPAKGSQGLRLAVKDNIDMRGVVTTGGSEYFARNSAPATKDAPCLAIARQRGVTIVGKTNMSEFATAPSGFNEYYGTPKSPLSYFHRLIPGGSSCGSAVAVARGYADVSFGTDTAGSVRVPAACCGVVGLKTTQGLVSVKGVLPIDPIHLDTVGPIGKNIEATAKGMDLLESGFASKYEAEKAAKPAARSIRVGRLKLEGTNAKVDQAVDDALARAGFQVIPLGDAFRQKMGPGEEGWQHPGRSGRLAKQPPVSGDERDQRADQSGDARGSGGISQWLSEGAGPAARVAAGDEGCLSQGRLHRPPHPAIDSAGIPPNLGIGLLEAFILEFQNTVAVNFAGNPALAVPIPVRHENVDLTSLQLVGPRRGEAALLNAGRLVEEAVKK